MKSFDKTQNRPSKITLFVASLLIVVGVFLTAAKLFADGGSNMYGYLWSSNIGWIDMNDCTNPADSTSCNPSGSFGVSVLPSAPGTMSGYAWSSNIGWITFNQSGCPASVSNCTPGAAVTWNTDGSGTVHGWARACSVYVSNCSGTLKDDSALGTWDGFIALDSKTAGGTAGAWGLAITTSKSLTGYAWGSQVIGWIKSINASIYVGGPTVSLVANPTSIISGASSVLTATAANIDGASSCKITASDNTTVPTLTMANSGSTWTGKITVSPTLPTTYTVACTKGSQVAKAQATVNVDYFTTSPGTGGGTGGNGGNNNSCSNGVPQLAWSASDAKSCQITATNQSGTSVSQIVATDSCAQDAAAGVQSIGGSNGMCFYPVNLLNSGSLTQTYTYTLQCTGGTTPVNLSTSVQSCGADFTLTAKPAIAYPQGSQAEPFTINKDGSATAVFMIGVSPEPGFVSDINNLMVVPSHLTGAQKALPADAATTFSSTAIPYNGGYGTATLTITVPDSKEIDPKATYLITVQGTGGTYTHIVTVDVNTKNASTPIFKEF